MKTTQRFCLTLDLVNEPKIISEYKHWHRPENIWPEIPEGIKAIGIENMEIYCLENRLFMIIEAGPEFDFGVDMARLAELPRQPEWENFVARFQKVDQNATSAQKWKLMEKIFGLQG
jgi:L-rhamnose mutarotase